jgi:YidC/Oxa1 family membrane protein insertase
MNNDQKRTVLALMLSGLVLFSWQAFFGPEQTLEQPVPTVETKTVETQTNVAPTAVATKTETTPQVNLQDLQEVTISKGDYSFTINSDFSIKEAKGHETSMSLEEFSGFKNFFKVRLVNSQNTFEVMNLKFEEIANASSINAYDNEKNIKVTFDILEDGRLAYSIISSDPIKLAYHVKSNEKSSANRTYRQFVLLNTDVERINVEDDERGEGKTSWLGVDFSHHLFATVFPKKISFKYVTTEAGEMFAQAINPATQYDGTFLYALKNYDYLSSLKDKTDLSIDFGLFGILAVPILKGLQYVYDYVGNYGIAIIILTFIIRFATFPLQFKSFKSMKKMQVVQPELAKIKEKYKDDPQRVQKETMELFKRAGANPLGGCLPMLLQVPIFIAFYQAINNSVELVGSPFYGWIVDLSSKDPYYVLPVLMGVTMLGQTKLNPSTTADPNQQKIMYIMPLVFCFIMKDLPAGLNLYFCVSNVLGIAQQLFVYKTVD